MSRTFPLCFRVDLSLFLHHAYKGRSEPLLRTSPFERIPNVGRVSKMKPQSFNKTDPSLIALIDELKAKERENGAAIWRDIAKRLEKPRRNWAETNLSKLDRYAEDGQTIVVAGKVLAAGSISKKITVAAYAFSAAAKEAIVAAGGKVITISDLVAENPKGSNVRIMR